MSKDEIQFITPYNGKIKKVQIEFNDVSLTDQSCKDECDIGFIIENFVRTGQLPEKPNMSYVDCTTVQQFEDSMQLVAETKTAFELLPAEDRDEFKTVSGWLSYVNNPDNLAECVKRGYIADSEAVQQILNPQPIVEEKVVSEAQPTVSESIKEVNANS